MADYPKQLRERITKFREQKGVSESRMSRELGQSKCYLQQISSGKTLPSMGAFFRIYEYLETLPIEFFWDDGIDSIYMHELLGRVKSMTKEGCRLLAHVGKIFERPGIYFQKIKSDFSKSDRKGAKCKPLEEHSSGACLSVCVYKRVRLK